MTLKQRLFNNSILIQHGVSARKLCPYYFRLLLCSVIFSQVELLNPESYGILEGAGLENGVIKTCIELLNMYIV